MVAGLEKSLAKQVERGKLRGATATPMLGRVTATARPRTTWTTATS